MAILLSPAPVHSSAREPKLVGHLVPHGTKAGCTGIDLPPCNPGEGHLRTVGGTGVGYDLYLLLVDGDPARGTSRVKFGISYPMTGPAGLQLHSWTSCSDSELAEVSTGTSWPDSGSGNVLTWEPETRCLTTPARGDTDAGVTALLGSFYVYAYSPAMFRIAPGGSGASGDLSVADCSGRERAIASPANAGVVSFGPDATGYDPCSAPDTLGPLAVTGLEVEGGVAAQWRGKTVSGYSRLTWTAPRDVGPGYVVHYDVRYSVPPLNEATWDSGTAVPTSRTPLPAGEPETLLLPPLPANREFEVGIRSLDSSGNPSPLATRIFTTLPPLEPDFQDTIAFPPTGEIWIAGHPVNDHVLVAGCKAGEFTINGIPIPFEGGWPITMTRERRQQVYGSNAFVAGKLAMGVDIDTAVQLLRSAEETVLEAARESWTTGGLEAAKRILNESGLFRSAEITGPANISAIDQALGGMCSIDLRYRPDPNRPTSGSSSVLGRKLIATLRSWADVYSRYSDPPYLLISSQGSLMQLSGSEGVSAHEQLIYLQMGGDVSGLPDGPLHPENPMIWDVHIVALEANER